jgi:hypothetical protein
MWYEWWAKATRKMCLLVALAHRIFFGWAKATREVGQGNKGIQIFFGLFFENSQVSASLSLSQRQYASMAYFLNNKI